jgi:TRAP-type C4-dicarboxylate transport system permease small subunit
MPARGIGDIVLDWVAALLLAATVLLSFAQVIARYILLISTPWTEELARLLFVWAVFLGAAIGVKRNMHTRVDFLFVRLPPRATTLLLAGMDVLLAGMAVVMVLYGGQLVLSTKADFSTSLGYPRNWFYLPVPLSGILMLRYLLPGIARRLSSGRVAPPGDEG